MSIFKLIEPVSIEDTGEFSRASTASYFNSSGILTTAAVNEPRLNYRPLLVDPLPSTGTGGLTLLMPTGPQVAIVPAELPIEFLVEDAATNLMVQSQDISGWTAAAATFVANAGTAPDSTASADKLIPTAASTAVHGAFRLASAAVSSGATVGASIFLQEAGYPEALFRCAPTGQASGFEMRVDLGAGEIVQSGAFGAGALAAVRLFALPGGWFRLEMEGAIAGVTTYGLAVHVGDGESYSGDTMSGVSAWGWQLELGAVSSYIPTASAAVTRAADLGTPMLVSGLPENEAVYSDEVVYPLNAVVRGQGAAAHSTFISLIADNEGNPLSDTTKWLAAGATNRWRPFDKVVSAKSVSPETQDFIIIPDQFADTLVLLGLSAGEVRIAQVDETEGLVFDQVYSLVDDSEITDWYAYFFNDIRRKTKLIVSDLLPYSSAQIAVMLSDVEATVETGECVVGRAAEIGQTQAGASVGTQDYSRKVRDEFGYYSFVERAFTRRMRCNILVEKPKVDYANNLFAAYRARPIVYIASDFYDSTVIYGVAKDAEAVIAHPDHSFFAFDGESLI